MPTNPEDGPRDNDVPRSVLGIGASCVIFFVIMAIRRISFAENEYYHIYNRGTDKRIIYESSSDYCRFVELLYLMNTSDPISLKDIKKSNKNIFEYNRADNLVAIGAYCLMPNHFHILLTPLVEEGVTTFMRKVTTGYSMYFNKKYERTGSLFEGRYKSKHADSDEYLKYLFSYIHLNPVKLIQSDWKEKGVRDVEQAYRYVENFGYSSLQDYLHNSRIEKKIINTEMFPDYFDNSDKDKIKDNLFDWLTLNLDNIE